MATTWLKWQCEKGNQWLSPDGSLNHDEAHGEPCNYPGCKDDHKIIAKGQTQDRAEAGNWLFDVRRGK